MRHSEKVSLDEMLEARDIRVLTQHKLTEKYSLPLISFTMNIAGDIKRYPQSDIAFFKCLERIEGLVGLPREKVITDKKTGLEAFLVYEENAEKLKDICVAIEEDSDIGRLYDLDVINTDGTKLSRSTMRKCIVCGGDVSFCSRSRAHGLDAIKEATLHILNSYVSDLVSDLACNALISEASLSPKPGLVDSIDCGAHKDMNLELLIKSAKSLKPYFKKLALFGLYGKDGIDELKNIGIEGENSMFSSTGGVNTHKGAVYLLGLIVLGCSRSIISGEDALIFSAFVSSKLAGEEENSHGDIVRKSLHVAYGPRTEATGGFRNVKSAAIKLYDGYSPLRVLLEIMGACDDTTVLHRAGREGLDFVKSSSKNILNLPDSEFEDALIRANQDFINKNISPGGSADILSSAMFLSDFCKSFDIPLT